MNQFKVKVKVKVIQSCPTLCNPVDYSPWHSLVQNTGVGSLSLLQGIFPTQGSNPGLPHCRQILYQLSHKGSPRILNSKKNLNAKTMKGSLTRGTTTEHSWVFIKLLKKKSGEAVISCSYTFLSWYMNTSAIGAHKYNAYSIF